MHLGLKSNSGLTERALGRVDRLGSRVDIWPNEKAVERFVEHSCAVEHFHRGQVRVFVSSGVPSHLTAKKRLATGERLGSASRHSLIRS